MFAFALWDERQQALYLARDAFGIKPLYHALVGSGIVIASEVRAIVASGVVRPHIDRTALAGYLTLGLCPNRRRSSAVYARSRRAP